jgi:hypothetical protein
VFCFLLLFLFSCKPKVKKVNELYEFQGIQFRIPKDFYLISSYDEKFKIQDGSVSARLNQYSYFLQYEYKVTPDEDDTITDTSNLSYTIDEMLNIEYDQEDEDAISYYDGEIQNMETKDKQEIRFFARIKNQKDIELIGVLKDGDKHYYRLSAQSSTLSMSYLYKKTMGLWYSIKKI